MPLYSSDSRSRLLQNGFVRSPKISIVTDATDIRSIPREILGIVRDERRIVRDYQTWSKSRSGDDSAACLVWYVGDRLIQGRARDLLKRLHSADRRSFVVVNSPCVEEVPYVTIQPRILAGAASIEYRSFGIRIESAAPTTTGIMVDSSRPPESWARLVEAISLERATPGSGVEPLLRLWESREKVSDTIGALVLRNLVAAMLWHKENESARKFLEAGSKLYPTYADLHYQAAWLAVREQRFGEAFPALERAKSCGTTIPGCGGENSYRCDWLLGVLAAKVGKDRAAFQYFLSGLKCSPLFETSLADLLKLALPRSLIESHQHEFSRIARSNPNVAPRIAEYLSTHGVLDAAYRVAQSVHVDSGEPERSETQLASSTVAVHASANVAGDRDSRGGSKQSVGIVLEGPFFEHSSFARVNREIARYLLSSNQNEVRLETSTPGAHPPHLFPDGQALTQSIHKQLQQTHVTIRHQWPPNLRRPPTGKLAVILPWEYGGVPRVWIKEIQQNVDELWVPSNFVREVFVRTGVDPERVTVIPNGYDPQILRPDGPSLRPQGSREFIFLFVGGAIHRKGIDLLLDAYRAAFAPSESVTLVILVCGLAGAYQHNSLIPEIRAAATDPNQPPIIPIFETIDDSTLANLYRGADAFVLPYRGEGFGMPLLEAMACGTPVITTAEGPTKDFCDESNSYLVPARPDLVLDKPPPLGPIVGSFVWFEPAFLELVKTLRHVWKNREEAAAKGRAAARSVRHLTWQYVTSQYAARIQRLCESPVRDER